MTKRTINAIVRLLGVILLSPLGPAAAADLTVRTPVAHANTLPFPRSERAQSVWASGSCWRDCSAYCAWGQTGCLTHDAQGTCLKLADTCDRYCQRQCRTSGGPLLPLDF